MDFRVLPRTSISYDQIWNYYKGDTGTTDQSQLFSLSNGQLVDLGVSFNAGANQPCANTFVGPPPGDVNPTCSAYFNFLRHARTRTNSPTEQLSMQSNYWKSLDLSARYSYTGGDAMNELAAIALDPNVHIQEDKALTVDIRPGRRPRGAQRRELVEAYIERAGITAQTGAEGV